jgi:hypothetical protein
LSRTRLALALVAAIAALLVAAAPAAAQGRDFYGVAPQGGLAELTPRDFDLMQQAGVGSMRLLVVHQTGDAAQDVNRFDRAIGLAAMRGIRSMPFIYQRPAPRSRAQRRALASFANAMARRYGPNGEYWRLQYQVDAALAGVVNPPARPIVSWQILNEQNGRAFWGSKPSPRAYARTLRMTAQAIRREHSRAEIVLGGMFFSPRGKGSMTSAEYLRRLYRVKGIKGAFTSVAIHPYAPRLKGIRQQIQRVRKVMTRNRHRKARIRITELGWGSARRGHPLNQGRRGQARMLRKSFGMLKKNRKRWRIRGVHWFSWQDGTAPCKFCPSSGLVTAERQPKPSYRAFRAVAR